MTLSARKKKEELVLCRARRWPPTKYGINNILRRLQRGGNAIHKRDVEVFQLFGESLRARISGLSRERGSHRRWWSGKKKRKKRKKDRANRGRSHLMRAPFRAKAAPENGTSHTSHGRSTKQGSDETGKLRHLPGRVHSWAASGSRRSAGSRNGGDGERRRGRHALKVAMSALTRAGQSKQSQGKAGWLTIFAGPKSNQNLLALAEGMDSVDCTGVLTSESCLLGASQPSRELLHHPWVPAGTVTDKLFHATGRRSRLIRGPACNGLQRVLQLSDDDSTSMIKLEERKRKDKKTADARR